MSEQWTPGEDAAFRAAAKGNSGPRVKTGPPPDTERDNGDPHAHRRLDLDRIVALADTKIHYRCQNLLADGFLTVLAGRGGDGKSLTAMALAGGVLTGSTIAGIDCEPGRVAIFDAENGPRLIGQRLKLSGIPHAGLTIYDADGLDLAADYEWIAMQLVEHDVAVFDSLRTLAPGAEENSSDDMGPLITALRRLARKTNTAILLIHHRGRDSDRDYRGSSTIQDQVDLMFVLERDDKDPERNWRRRLRCVKCRIDREPMPRWIGIKLSHGELHLTEAAPFTSERASPKRDEVSDQAYAIILRDGPIRRADVARKLGRDPSDRTLRNAVERLHETAQITPIGDLWTVVNSPDDNPTGPKPPNANNDTASPLVANPNDNP